MDSALLYLLRRSFINKAKQFIKTPSKLAVLIVIVLLFILNIVSGLKVVALGSRNVEGLNASVFGYFSLFFILGIKNGIEKGNSAFLMSDINILFVSPIHQRKIFTYGLMKTLAASMLGSVFLIYQYNFFKINFDVTFLEFTIIFLVFSTFMFLYQFTFFVTYSFVSSSEKYSLIAKIAYYLPFVIILAYIMFLYFQNDDFFKSATIVINYPIVQYIPIIGWSVSIIKYFALGNYTYSFMWLCINIVYFLVLYFIIANRNTEFYEDVISSAKNNEKIINFRKTGRRNEKFKNKKTFLGKSNLKGSGSTVFFYINRLLNRRTNSFFIPKTTIVMIGFTFFMSFVIEGDKTIPYMTAMSVYIALIVFLNSRFDDHLKKHFVYMIPESSFRKLISLVLAEMYLALIETIILYSIIAFLYQGSILEVIAYGVVRFTLVMVVISVDILVKRILGKHTGLSRMLFIILGMIFIAIPVTGGTLLGGFFPFKYASMIAIAISSVVESVVIISTCSDLLDDMKW